MCTCVRGAKCNMGHNYFYFLNLFLWQILLIVFKLLVLVFLLFVLLLNENFVYGPCIISIPI